MPKRNATMDINHENWNAEYIPEEAGNFQRAPPDIIEKRVIKSAKRRSIGDTKFSGGNSLFSGFKGFSKESTSSSSFSFLATTNVNSASVSNTKFCTSARKKDEVTHEILTNVTQDGSECRLQIPLTGTMMGNVERLNESFIKWITFHFHANKHVDFAICFKDYESHMKSILNHNAAHTEEKSVDGPHNTIQENVFSAKRVLGPSHEEVQPSVNHNMPGTPDNRHPGMNSPFSIRGAFSVPATTASPSPFRMNENKVEKSEEKNDEDEPPPKVEFKPVVEDGSVYHKRCKVFVKKEDSFHDHGVGMLYVKPVSSGQQTQLIVRADTSLGKILLNTLLTKSMNIQKLGKNNVMMVCIPTPDSSPAKPVPVLLKVKTSEDAEEMLSKLNDNKK